MRHQQELGLTEEQKEYMKEQMQTAQSEFAGLEWDLQEALSTLSELIQAPKVEENAVITQLNKVLDIENNIKRTRLLLMVRLKNTLSPEQQATLEGLKQKRGLKGKSNKQGRMEMRHLHQNRSTPAT